MSVLLYLHSNARLFMDKKVSDETDNLSVVNHLELLNTTQYGFTSIEDFTFPDKKDQILNVG